MVLKDCFQACLDAEIKKKTYFTYKNVYDKYVQNRDVTEPAEIRFHRMRIL